MTLSTLLGQCNSAMANGQMAYLVPHVWKSTMHGTFLHLSSLHSLLQLFPRYFRKRQRRRHSHGGHNTILEAHLLLVTINLPLPLSSLRNCGIS